MNFVVVFLLRILPVLIFLVAVLGQALIVPVVAVDVATTYPEVSVLQWPYTIAVNAGIGCVQVALVAVWALLSMVRRGAIFSDRAFAFVDLIIGAAAGATVLAIGAGVHLLGILKVGEALLPVGVAVIAGGAFILLMIVMRGLLRSATTLEAELAEVV